MADDRGASRAGDGDGGEEPPTQKRRNRRAATLIGMAVPAPAISPPEKPAAPPPSAPSGAAPSGVAPAAAPVEAPAAPAAARPLPKAAPPRPGFPKPGAGKLPSRPIAPRTGAPLQPARRVAPTAAKGSFASTLAAAAKESIAPPPRAPLSRRAVAPAPASPAPPAGAVGRSADAETLDSVPPIDESVPELAAEPTSVTGSGEPDPVAPAAAEPSLSETEASEAEAPATEEAEEPMELPGEPTNVTAAPPQPEESTQPTIDAPTALALDATQPAVQIPTEDPGRATPVPSAPYDPSQPATGPDDDLPSEPTIVVDPSVTGPAAPTYSMNLSSGEVAIAPDPAPAFDQPLEWEGRPSSRTGLYVGVALVCLLGVGGGVAGYVLLAPSASNGEVAISGAGPDVEEPGAAVVAEAVDPGVEPDDVSGDLEAPGDEGPGDEGPGDEALADQALADEALGDEALADEGLAEPDDETEGVAEGDAAGDAPANVATREELESFELDLPSLARRARRMNDGQRRRLTTRLKSQALRHYRAERYAEAEEAYRETLTYNTWDVAAVEGLARATAQQGRFPEAIAWGRLAVSRNPRSSAAYRVLGDVWRQAGESPAAAAVYRQGLRRHPGDRWLRQRLRDLSED